MASLRNGHPIARPITRITRSSAYAMLTLALLVATLFALAACSSTVRAGGTTTPGGGAQPTTPDGGTGTLGTGTLGTGTLGTGTPGTPSPQQGGPGASASPPTAPGAVPFSVSAVQIVSSPSNYNDTCTPTMTFTFTGEISVPAGTAGGTVTYLWVHDQSRETDTFTATFLPGQTSQTVSDPFSLPPFQGGGATHKDQLVVLTPNYLGSQLASFTFTCVVKVTGVSVSFAPTTFNCNSLRLSQIFTFKAVVSVTPGPASTGSYVAAFGRYGGTSSYSSGTFQIPNNATSVTVTIQHVVSIHFANGTYFETFWVEEPTPTVSYTATFTKSC